MHSQDYGSSQKKKKNRVQDRNDQAISVSTQIKAAVIKQLGLSVTEGSKKKEPQAH